MIIPILIANILTLLAFAIHTFLGDKDLKVNEPTEEIDKSIKKGKNGQWQDVAGIGFRSTCSLLHLGSD
jgi:hypothetical protein